MFEKKIIWWVSWLLIILEFRQSLFSHIPQRWSTVVYLSTPLAGQSRQVNERCVYLQPDTAISIAKYDLSGSYAGQGWPTLPFSALWHRTCNTCTLAFSDVNYSALGAGYPLFRHKLFSKFQRTLELSRNSWHILQSQFKCEGPPPFGHTQSHFPHTLLQSTEPKL
jgi:hypothetical protein